MFRFTIFALLACTLFSCKKDEVIQLAVPQNNSYKNVDQNLWSYFAAFEAEAAKRGIAYDLNTLQIEGSILELHQGNVAGVCSYNSAAPNLVRIDATFWSKASSLLKEMIVFHELGHCVITRDHYEEAHSNGSCKSIMRSGVGECLDNYNSNTRESYLDELFFNKVNLWNI